MQYSIEAIENFKVMIHGKWKNHQHRRHISQLIQYHIQSTFFVHFAAPLLSTQTEVLKLFNVKPNQSVSLKKINTQYVLSSKKAKTIDVIKNYLDQLTFHDQIESFLATCSKLMFGQFPKSENAKNTKLIFQHVSPLIAYLVIFWHRSETKFMTLVDLMKASGLRKLLKPTQKEKKESNSKPKNHHLSKNCMNSFECITASKDDSRKHEGIEDESGVNQDSEEAQYLTPTESGNDLSFSQTSKSEDQIKEQEDKRKDKLLPRRKNQIKSVKKEKNLENPQVPEVKGQLLQMKNNVDEKHELFEEGEHVKYEFDYNMEKEPKIWEDNKAEDSIMILDTQQYFRAGIKYPIEELIPVQSLCPKPSIALAYKKYQAEQIKRGDSKIKISYVQVEEEFMRILSVQNVLNTHTEVINREHHEDLHNNQQQHSPFDNEIHFSSELHDNNHHLTYDNQKKSESKKTNKDSCDFSIDFIDLVDEFCDRF